MNENLPPVRLSIRVSRVGFTLVELLVAVAIFAILAGLTLGAFNSAVEGDRGPTAARSLRAWVEGAKSRAAKLGRPVGLRPIISTSNLSGHAVSEFEYVAAVEPLAGNLQTTSMFLNGTTAPEFSESATIRAGLFFDASPGVNRWLVRQAPSETPSWALLDGLDADGNLAPTERRLIYPGLRINFPEISQRWFHISSVDPRTAGMTGSAALPGTFNPSHVVGGNTLNGFYLVEDIDGTRETVRTAPIAPTGPLPRPPVGFPAKAQYFLSTKFLSRPASALTYVLELGPDIIDGERRLSLPGGVLVDLDASVTPPSALPASATSPYGGFSLMFAPTGEVIGDYSGVGAISFYLDTRDALVAHSGAIDNPQTPWDETTHLRSAWVAGNADKRVVPVSSIGDPQVLTVLPMTGFAQTGLVDPTDQISVDATGTITGGPAPVTPDGWADAPYSNALRGELDQ